jgi:glycogen synthase
MRVRGMKQRFSWDRSADRYIDVYTTALSRRRKRSGV